MPDYIFATIFNSIPTVAQIISSGNTLISSAGFEVGASGIAKIVYVRTSNRNMYYMVSNTNNFVAYACYNSESVSSIQINNLNGNLYITNGAILSSPVSDSSGLTQFNSISDAVLACDDGIWSDTQTYPITYSYTNSTVSGPAEAAIGDTVIVSAVPNVDYGITDASSQIIVTNNDVAVPYTWDAANNTITFTMPDPT